MPPEGLLHRSLPDANRGRGLRCQERPQPGEKTTRLLAEGLSESLWGQSSNSPTTGSPEVGLRLSSSVLRRTPSTPAAGAEVMAEHDTALRPRDPVQRLVRPPGLSPSAQELPNLWQKQQCGHDKVHGTPSRCPRPGRAAILLHPGPGVGAARVREVQSRLPVGEPDEKHSQGN